MLCRLILIFSFGILFSCATARMVLDPALNTNFDQYKITERPGLFSGNKMKFGPYLVTDVKHSWSNSWSKSFSLALKSHIGTYKSVDKSQRYSYQFIGKRTWKSGCLRAETSKSLGIVSFGLEVGIDCVFIANAERGASQPMFQFSFKGTRLVEATGAFKAGEDGMENIRVVVTNKIQGTSLGLGSPTGYYFYAGKNLVAAVDNIRSDGPVWLSKSLSPDAKDRVSLAIVALLLYVAR